jgi:hypothetical protein
VDTSSGPLAFWSEKGLCNSTVGKFVMYAWGATWHGNGYVFAHPLIWLRQMSDHKTIPITGY